MRPPALLMLVMIGIGTNAVASAATAQAKPNGAPVVAPAITKADSLRGAMQDSTRAFLLTWRLAWFASAQTGEYQTEELRTAYAHCHQRTIPLDDYSEMVKKNYIVLTGKRTAAGFCPSWSLARNPISTDESDSIDVAIINSKRAAVKAARARLLTYLEAAHDSLPDDGWIAGQRVRFLVDQQRVSDALAVARRCTGEAWWCAALTGFVLQKQNLSVAAESSYNAAAASLTAEERCSWNDIGDLLQPKARLVYESIKCEDRAPYERNYWWLADPLFTVAGNERRVEHFTRRVNVMLHAGLDEDERYHWLPIFGGDAVEEMLTRFGWPSTSVWMGRTEDMNHNDYLRAYHSLVAAPYSTNEYSSGRVHFGAEWNSVIDPAHAGAAAWELNAPSNMRTGIRGRGDFWWPVEHMRFIAGPITQLPEGQTAFFRRQHDIQLATAVNTDKNSAPELASLLGHETTAALVLSTAPDSVQFVERYSAPLGARLVLSGAIPSRPAMLGIEASVEVPRRAFARTRFGIIPPLPLDSLPTGTLAISDPVFFSPLADGSLPSDVTAMLPHMLGSESTTRGAKVGMYWENYGVSADDSVHYVVSATLISNRSFFQKLTSALKLSDGGVSNVAVSWTDPRSRTRGAKDPNAVSILPRSIVLDLASLSKGTYSIEVTVTAKGRAPAHSGRVLQIK